MRSPTQLHPFLTSLYAKLDPVQQPKALAITDQTLVQYRDNSRTFLLDSTQVPGWRASAMIWTCERLGLPPLSTDPFYDDDLMLPRRNTTHQTRVELIGVRTDGRIMSGSTLFAENSRHLSKNSLGATWIDGIDSDNPHHQAAVYMAQLFTKHMIGQSAGQEAITWAQTQDTVKELAQVDDFSLDETTTLPLSTQGYMGNRWANKRSRSFHFMLKERLENAGLKKFTEENTPNARIVHQGLVRMTAAVAAQERRSLAYVSKTLLNELDPQALRMARSINEVSIPSINWMMGQPITNEIIRNDSFFSDYDGEEETKRRELIMQDYVPVAPITGQESKELLEQNAHRRHQALKAYPALGRTLMRTTGLTTTIDQGEPLAPQLAKTLGVPQKYVTRLQGQTWQRTTRRFYHESEQTMRTMALTAPEFIPQTKKGWQDFFSVQDAAVDYAQTKGEVATYTLRDINGRYQALAPLARNHVRGGFHDAGDHIAKHLTWPAVMLALHKKGVSEEDLKNWGGRPSAYVQIGPTAKGATLRQALETTDQWHRLVTTFNSTMLPEQADDRPWPHPTNTIDIKGITAHPLNSTQKLNAEGRKQDHCVGGYTDHCLSGRSIIYSLREDKRILSTIEIHAERDQKGWTFSINQNMDQKNNTPSKIAQEAGKALVQHLKDIPSETLDAWQTKLTEERNARKGEKESLKSRCDYDPLDEALVRKAWTTLRPCLPRAWGQKTFEDWMDKTIRPLTEDPKFNRLIPLNIDGQQKPQKQLQV